MSKDRIRGTGAVYGFTLRQIVRNKANMITMGIMLICIAGAIPVMSFFFGDKEGDVVYSGYTNIRTAEEYLTEGQVGFDARYGIQYAYAIIVVMICVFSVAYIVRTVVEEKASKLVETLIVSVPPMALLLGKILAVMTYIIGLLCVFAGVFGLSYYVSGKFLDVSFVGEFLAGKGISMDILNIGGGTAVVVLISLILAYLLFSFIAGLAGAGCSNMEEVGGASTASTWAILLGYFASVFGGMSSSVAVHYILALCPVVSAFSAPVLYVFGDIGIGVLIVSWVIQLVVIGLLIVLSERVYEELILYKGDRLSMRKILSVATNRGGAKK